MLEQKVAKAKKLEQAKILAQKTAQEAKAKQAAEKVASDARAAE